MICCIPPHLFSFLTTIFLYAVRKSDLADSTSSVLDAFKFIENAAPEYSDDDDDSQGKDKTIIDSATVSHCL